MRAIQLRDKALDDRARLAAAEGVAGLCRPSGARAFVNDRVDIAALAGTGVHLGEDDLPASEARAILPQGALIGVSTHDAGAARRALEDPACDYVAFGPVFASGTKSLAAAARPRGARARRGRPDEAARGDRRHRCRRGSTRSGTRAPTRRR